MADENLNGHPPDSMAARVSPDKREDIESTITESSSKSSMVEGLYSLISSVMTGFDSNAEATTRSQDQLSTALDRLTAELDKLLDDAPSPFIMQHSARIASVRKRVKALNSLLKSIQRRIDNMDLMLSTRVGHEKLMTESSGQQ